MSWLYNGRKYWYHKGKRYSCRIKKRYGVGKKYRVGYFLNYFTGQRIKSIEVDYKKWLEGINNGRRGHKKYVHPI